MRVAVFVFHARELRELKSLTVATLNVPVFEYQERSTLQAHIFSLFKKESAACAIPSSSIYFFLTFCFYCCFHSSLYIYIYIIYHSFFY
jgi:hypothetical protein